MVSYVMTKEMYEKYIVFSSSTLFGNTKHVCNFSKMNFT
jgi:hypothetical protein